MLPEKENLTVPKYNGKAARLLALKDAANMELSDDTTVRQIKEVIAKYIYKTPLWGPYRERYSQLLKETASIEVRNEFLGAITTTQKFDLMSPNIIS